MKYLIILVLGSFLIGCSRDVTPKDYDLALQVCAPNEGLYRMSIDVANIYAKCNNGISITIPLHKQK